MNIKLNLYSICRLFLFYYALGLGLCIVAVVFVHLFDDPLFDSFIFRLFLRFSNYRYVMDTIAAPIGLSGWIVHNLLLAILLLTAWLLNSNFPIKHFFKFKELMKRANITVLGVAAFISFAHFNFVLVEEHILSREIKKIENENLRLEIKFEGLIALKDIYGMYASEEKKLELISAGHYIYNQMRERFFTTRYVNYNFSESVIDILKQHDYKVQGNRLLNDAKVKMPLKARIDRLEIQQAPLTNSSSKSSPSYESKRNQLLEKSIESGVTEFVKEITLGGLGVEFHAETKFFVEELISELATFFYHKSLHKIRDAWGLTRFKLDPQTSKEIFLKHQFSESMLQRSKDMMERFRSAKSRPMMLSVNESTGLLQKSALSEPFKDILREIEFTNNLNNRIARGPTIEEIKRRNDYRMRRLKVRRR